MIMPFSSSIFLLFSPVVETKGQRNYTTRQEVYWKHKILQINLEASM